MLLPCSLISLKSNAKRILLISLSSTCVYVLLATLVACRPLPSSQIFHVRRLLSHEKIEVGDQRLSDWPTGYLVWETAESQWTTVRDRTPKQLVQGDLHIQVFMAHDGDQWYVAINARDDRLVTATDPIQHPHGGDSFELFFAGEHLQSQADFHHLIGSSNRELLQVIVSPASNNERGNVLSGYRTDGALQERMLQPGSSFTVSVWRITQNQWAAELRLPIEVFSDEVRRRIRDGLNMRIGFDYLDYDGDPAKDRDLAPEYGFSPDNVFSHDNNEKNVNVPNLMPSIVFKGA